MLRYPLIDAVSAYYENMMFDPFSISFFGEGNHNMGHWVDGVTTGSESCDQLFARLMTLLPETRGAILDVGCGLGGNVVRLLEHYPPARITGINISRTQIEQCRVRAPECRFELMDATEMRFQDCSFDDVLCVEAAFHFDTREKFLTEALRVLKPGGHLVMSDILMSPPGVFGMLLRVRRRLLQSSEKQRNRRIGPKNLIPVVNTGSSIPAYRELFERIGFVDVRVSDATDHVVGPYCDAGEAMLHHAREANAIEPAKYRELSRLYKQVRTFYRPYVLVHAQRPAS